MVLYYAKLIRFSTTPTFGNMFESKLTKSVYNWVGEAQVYLTDDMVFNVEYIYNFSGIAVDVNICITKDGQKIGCYSTNQKLSTILNMINNIIPAKTNHPDSDPIHYYAPGYYAPGYYV